MDEIQIPEGAAFRIQLPTFEGPLDLLLHLIKKHELNILDLPIAFVTERYLDYLGLMQELDLDVASEYLLMAATLAHIKSKMLLPANPLEEVEEHDDGYVEDPRAELIRRLLEYQKYRAAAEQLGARPIAGRDVFARGLQTEEAQGPAPLAPIDLYKLLDAFGAILKRVQGRVALEVTAERITIHERISDLSELLRIRRSCTFEELFAKDRTRYEVVVTFLALLEMTKLRITRVYQADSGSPIHVHYALLDADAPTIPPDELAENVAAHAEGAQAPDALVEPNAQDNIETLAEEALEDETLATDEPADETLTDEELAEFATDETLTDEELAEFATDEPQLSHEPQLEDEPQLADSVELADAVELADESQPGGAAELPLAPVDHESHHPESGDDSSADDRENPA